MCLTEAHAGSDLGIIRTKAEPNDDGSFAITGQKIFISAGEHDMADNIVQYCTWLVCPTHHKAQKEFRYLSCQNLTSMQTAQSVNAMR